MQKRNNQEISHTAFEKLFSKSSCGCEEKNTPEKTMSWNICIIELNSGDFSPLE